MEWDWQTSLSFRLWAFMLFMHDRISPCFFEQEYLLPDIERRGINILDIYTMVYQEYLHLVLVPKRQHPETEGIVYNFGIFCAKNNANLHACSPYIDFHTFARDSPRT